MEAVSVTNGFGDFQDRCGMWVKSFGYRELGVRKLFRTRAYILWMGILSRTSKTNARNNIRGNSAINEFIDFQQFAEWCQGADGYLNKDSSGNYWHLDKDLYSIGNRVYSPETCIFIPASLNDSFPTSPGRRKSDNLQGVTLLRKSGKYQAATSYKNKHVHLGTFNTKQLAHKAWQEFRVKVMEDYLSTEPCTPRIVKGLETMINKIKEDISNGRPTDLYVL
jgi:hypothetical protein